MKSNKKQGNKFEKDFMKLLSEHGFICHKFVENENGAPFDIIACKNGVTHCFECKVIEMGTVFPLSRVEENQRIALPKWSKHSCTWFTFQTKKGIYVAESKEIFSLIEANRKSIDILQIQGISTEGGWMMQYENNSKLQGCH